MDTINLKAISDPQGGAIRLTWDLQNQASTGGIALIRSTGEYARDILRICKEQVVRNKDTETDVCNCQKATCTFCQLGLTSYRDNGLKPQVWYYYQAIPFKKNEVTGEVQFDADTASRACTLATSRLMSNEQMYTKLPAIYHRYDSAQSGSPDTPGPLQKFLSVIGSQYDYLRSFTAGITDLWKIDRCPGNLLPLLAQWTGWQSNMTLGYNGQRNEIRQAPELFKTIGIPANLEALVNRLTNCRTELKEFTHNVFLSNDPVCTTIWWQGNLNGKGWSNPEPVSLNAAPDGTLRCAEEIISGETSKRTWLFFHTRSEQGARVEYKLLHQLSWSSAMRIESDTRYNKYPCAVPAFGGMLLFWSSKKDRTSHWKLATRLIARGCDATPAKVQSCAESSYTLKTGDKLTILVKGKQYPIIFNEEDFLQAGKSGKITAAPEEIARIIAGAVPGIKVTITESGAIVIQTAVSGSNASIEILEAPAALGFATGYCYLGTKSHYATLRGIPCNPAILQTQLTEDKSAELVLRVNETVQIVRFTSSFVRKISTKNSLNVTADQIHPQDIVAWINDKCNGISASLTVDNAIQMCTVETGVNASLEIDCTESTAAAALGFPPGVPYGASYTDQLESSATVTSDSTVWLAFAERKGLPARIVVTSLCTDENGVLSWTEADTPISDMLRESRDPILHMSSDNELRCFWNKRIADGWQICYRYASLTSGSIIQWEDIKSPGTNPSETNIKIERYPFVHQTKDNKLELVTIDKSGSWKIVSRILTDDWNKPEIISESIHKVTSPILFYQEGYGEFLIYRSSRPAHYQSNIYSSSKTLDQRWCGSTTFDPSNRGRRLEMRRIDDTIRYTYDTGKKEDNWYSFNTVGLYLFSYNQTEQQRMNVRIKELVQGILSRYLPINLRIVFIFSPHVYREYLEEEGRELLDNFNNKLLAPEREEYDGIYSDVWDRVPQWNLFHSREPEKENNSKIGDPNERTWHPWIKQKRKSSHKGDIDG